MSIETLDKTLDRLNGNYYGEKLKSNNLNSIDDVNKPKHYNRSNAIEAIEEMEMIFGPKVVMDFCLCNVWKYRYRAADKNHEQDIAKSDWYMQKYKELLYKMDTKITNNSSIDIIR